MIHVAANVVDVRAFWALGTANNDVISGVHTVAAGAVGAEQIVPAVVVDEVGSLTVDGDVLLFVATLTETSSGVELDEADGAEIGAIAYPQTTCGGVEHDTWVDGVLVFHAIGGANLNGGTPLEVGRLRIERLVPHRQDAAAMTST